MEEDEAALLGSGESEGESRVAGVWKAQMTCHAYSCPIMLSESGHLASRFRHDLGIT